MEAMRALSTIPRGEARGAAPPRPWTSCRAPRVERRPQPAERSSGSRSGGAAPGGATRQMQDRADQRRRSWRARLGSSGPGSTATASCSAGCGSAPGRKPGGASITGDRWRPCGAWRVRGAVRDDEGPDDLPDTGRRARPADLGSTELGWGSCRRRGRRSDRDRLDERPGRGRDLPLHRPRTDDALGVGATVGVGPTPDPSPASPAPPYPTVLSKERARRPEFRRSSPATK